MSEVDKKAKIIWDFMLVHDELRPVDLIICLGSHDLNVARRAAELYLQKFAPKILITGGRGKLTKHDMQTEAAAFAAILYAAGVPQEDVLIEAKSTNTGENVQFSHAKLNDINFDITSAIVVTKPYMERRVKATFEQLWPELETVLTSQVISYEDYMNQSVLGKEKSINVMVGDLQRIIEYPDRGWMISQVVPEDVRDAYTSLVETGYNQQLI